MADFLIDLYNAIDPDTPLQPGDPAYVDCQDVRGNANVFRDLGRKILRSHQNTCQLYAGHRGAGKSTELLRLKQYLEERGCFVVYFEAVGDNRDIDPHDAEYTDILLACTRHLLTELKQADPRPVVSWLRDRANALKEAGQMEFKLDSAPEIEIAFVKLTTAIRAIPTQRQQIRKELRPHTITLLTALNEVIADARRQLPQGKNRLVVIVDNLDRIVPNEAPSGILNHDEIYLYNNEQLRGLDCHIVYTVPISLVHSNRASELMSFYGDPTLLPMVMVQTPDGELFFPGFERMRSVIANRVHPLQPTAKLDQDVFANAQAVQTLCIASGGHMRELAILVKMALDYTDELPIPTAAVQWAVGKLRDSYRRTVGDADWPLLATVAKTKRIKNDDQHRALLFRRCLLEYRLADREDNPSWYDVHPVIKAIPDFQEAWAAL